MIMLGAYKSVAQAIITFFADYNCRISPRRAHTTAAMLMGYQSSQQAQKQLDLGIGGCLHTYLKANFIPVFNSLRKLQYLPLGNDILYNLLAEKIIHAHDSAIVLALGADNFYSAIDEEHSTIVSCVSPAITFALQRLIMQEMYNRSGTAGIIIDPTWSIYLNDVPKYNIAQPHSLNSKNIRPFTYPLYVDWGIKHLGLPAFSNRLVARFAEDQYTTGLFDTIHLPVAAESYLAEYQFSKLPSYTRFSAKTLLFSVINNNFAVRSAKF